MMTYKRKHTDLKITVCAYKCVHTEIVHLTFHMREEKQLKSNVQQANIFQSIMSFSNLLKSTGAFVSSAKNQYADIERMFQGYTQNPYLNQQSETYENAYYPGYM